MLIPIYLELPGEIVPATHLTPQELKMELAIYLFQQGKLSFGKARELTNLPVLQFQHLLASRNIPIHYDITDYEEDLATLQRLGRL